MSPLTKIFGDILLGIVINIIASYFIFPQLLRPQFASQIDSSNYYNRNDIYIAVYFGLVLSAIELVVVLIGVVIF